MIISDSSNKIAFIESNTTGTGEEFIKSALRNNLSILFLTATPNKYKFIDELLIYPVVIDTNDVEKVFNYLKDISNLKGVISTSELFAYNAAKIAQLLSLPHNEPRSIENCRNKFDFSKLLLEAQLPSIKTKLINQYDHNLTVLLKEFSFPIIVKPNSGTGSTGVKLCSSFEQTINHIDCLSNNGYLSQGILVQEYVLGEEFSIEVVALEGKYHILGITKKYLGSEPYFLEVGHEFPAVINNFITNKIIYCVIKALETVGFKLGAAHVEFRLVNEDVYIIEINPRLAGGMIPILIEQSQGIKLIDNLVKLFVGEKVEFIPESSFVTKIEFFLPHNEGNLEEIKGLDKAINSNNIFNIGIYKAIGDIIKIKHDFSDRLGFIIAKSDSIDTCKKAIIDACKHVHFRIKPINTDDKIAYTRIYARNRLNNKPTDPQAKQILESNCFDNFNEIKLLSDINKAHVIMLQKCNIISLPSARKILSAINKLEQQNFNIIKQIENYGIGNYLAYEQYLVNILGIKIAGNMHIARSRNDINATITRLKSRHVFINLYSAIWKLRSEILQVATNSLDIVMPVYSQYQAAMPGTYAYYLLAIENMIASHQLQLKQTISTINTSTMGAVCGSGTTFPIDLNIVTELLGFDYPISNALVSVASRNLELTLLSIGTMIGLTISRIAQDYQIWSTQEFAFFDIPDELCGISSTMPQKKNPYLLEKIKGKAISIIGKLVSALAVMQKTPFANSVEVGTESLIGFEETFNELIKAVRLLQLIIKNAKPIQSNMLKSNIGGLTIATAIAETLTRDSCLSYRESYSRVAENIVAAINKGDDPLGSILQHGNFTYDLTKWHLLFEYGKGPGKASMEASLTEAILLLNSDALFFQNKVNKWNIASKLLYDYNLL